MDIIFLKCKSKRKKLLHLAKLLMCVMILLMGLGYALLSTQLSINGSTAITHSKMDTPNQDNF